MKHAQGLTAAQDSNPGCLRPGVQCSTHCVTTVSRVSIFTLYLDNIGCSPSVRYKSRTSTSYIKDLNKSIRKSKQLFLNIKPRSIRND